MRERMQKERNEKNKKEASRGIHYIPWREAFLCRAFYQAITVLPKYFTDPHLLVVFGYRGEGEDQ